MSSLQKIMRFRPRKVLTACKYSVAVSLGCVGAFQLWSRQCYFEPFGPESDPLFQSHYLHKFNPEKYPSFHDSCVRKVPLSDIPPELVDDALKGGSKLMERFCAGIWGGYGYAIQRKIMNLFGNARPNDGVLWEKRQLLESTYEKGTIVTDHFIVLQKSPRSIIMRGGMSPSNSSEKPRERDGLAVVTVDIDHKQGVAEFRLKNILFNGVKHTTKSLLPPPFAWLHFQYSKLLVESGVSNCVA